MRVVVGFIAFVFSCLSAAADPSDYSRNISFGDSLSDNGNLFHNLGQPPSPPYFDGRFSNGPTWIELLSNPAKSTNPDSSMNRFWTPPFFAGPPDIGGNVNNVNASIGGATAQSSLQSVFSSDNNAPIGIPSVPTQINAFLAAGGTFGPHDLVSVQGGANDFFNFFNNTPAAQIPGLLPGFATNVGIAETENVATLIGAGAKTILVSNLPNLGATPNFNTNPNSANAGFLATVTYNSTLNAGVQQLAALNPNVNLIQMDWFSALNVILANPAAYGFTDVTHQCLGNPNCNQITAQGFLFWDGVHPTEAAHQLLARYAALLLSTEQTGKAVGALGQVALSTRLEASDILFRRGAAPGQPGHGGLYAEAIGSTGSVDGTNTIQLGNTGVDYSLGGVRAGFDATYGSLTFGTALAFQSGSIDGHLLRSNLRATQGDAYALMRFNPFFVGAEAGVSLNEYNDLKRNTGFGPLDTQGATRSVDYTVAATLGSQYQMGGITLTPAGRVGFASVNIDGFSESAPILALDYSDRNISTGFYTVRLRASSQFLSYTHAVAYAEIGYENLFSSDSSYTAKLANNTAHGVVINDNDLEGRGVFVKAGIGGYLTDNIKVSGEYGLATQNGQGDVHSGRLRLTIPLSGE